MNLMVTNGWVTSIDLETEDGILPTQKILVDYDRLPMRCKACHSWKHRVRDCNKSQKLFVRGGRRPTQAQPTYQKEKRKSIAVDEDGFQLVNNHKHTRRNICEKDNAEERINASAQAVETKPGRIQTTPQASEVHRSTRCENTTENNKEGSDSNTLQGGTQGGWGGDPRPASGGASRKLHEISTAEEEATVRLESVVEGRGDPASTMLWSPRKHARHKRPLEHEVHEASEDEDYGSEAATADFEEDSLGDEADAAQDEEHDPEVGDLMQIDGGEVAVNSLTSNLQVEGTKVAGMQSTAEPLAPNRQVTEDSLKVASAPTAPPGRSEG